MFPVVSHVSTTNVCGNAKKPFPSWDPTLLQKLQRDHPELGDHALLVADAQKRNRELRRQQANPPAHPSALQRSAQHPSSQHAPSGERPILLPIEVAKPAAPAETSDSGSDYASHCSSNDTASISFESEQAPQRATRPPSKAEFIPLNKDLLQQRLVCVEALRFRKNLSLEEAILRRWGNQNPTQNWEGRECWIYAPEKNKALSKVARGVEEDYTALQFLLANQEAKQVELLQDSTQIVFIHVSEESKLFSSEIYELENLKEKSTDGFAVVVFGMRDLKAKTGVFQQVWSVGKFSGLLLMNCQLTELKHSRAFTSCSYYHYTICSGPRSQNLPGCIQASTLFAEIIPGSAQPLRMAPCFSSSGERSVLSTSRFTSTSARAYKIITEVSVFFPRVGLLRASY